MLRRILPLVALSACSAPAEEHQSESESGLASPVTYSLDRTFAAELFEVSLGDPSGLKELWFGTYQGTQYDASWYRGWHGPKQRVADLVIAGSGRPEPGANDLQTFPWPEGAVTVPSLQSIGDIKSAVMIRTSNPVEAAMRLKYYDVAGGHLYGHSAGAWVAAVMAVIGGAREADLYGVPFFWPIDGDLVVGGTTLHFHTHDLDPVGWAFDAGSFAGVSAKATWQYGEFDHDHKNYRGTAPSPAPLTPAKWQFVKQYLDIRLDIAKGNRTIQLCDNGQPCVPDNLGGVGY